jgi:hypothetical protein
MDDIDRYYEILELKSGASLEDLKRAYRDLVRVWHPDRFSHDPRLQQKAQEKLKEINEAYEKLQAFLSAHRARAYRPQSGPSQSHPHGESGKTRSGDSQAAPGPPPQGERTRENAKASSAGIWAAFLAWLRYEYELMPAVAKVAVVVVLLLILITSTQNSRSKQTSPEPVKTPATGTPSREAPARKKATAKSEPQPTSGEESGEHRVSPESPGGLERPESMLSNLPPEDQTWVTRSCPRSLGPSLWDNCVRREVNTLLRGRPDLSNLTPDERNWVLRSCPTSLGPSLAISCLNRELQALARGMPDLSALRADERAWVQQSCPQSLGPLLYRSCVSREARAVTGGTR